MYWMVRLQLFLSLLYCFVFCIRVEYHCLSANAEAAAALFYCFLNKFISGLRRAYGLSTNPYPVHRLDKVRTVRYGNYQRHRSSSSSIFTRVIVTHVSVLISFGSILALRRELLAFWSSRVQRPWHGNSHSNFVRVPSTSRTSHWSMAMQRVSRRRGD